MLRNLVLVALFAMFLVPAAAQAQFDEGDWEMTLGGSGRSDDSFDNTILSVDFSIGYFFNDNLEAGIRQGIAFSDSDGTPVEDPTSGVVDIVGAGSDFTGTTTGFVDYHFDLDAWQPFVGAFIGLTYGDGDTTSDDGVYGPEGGVKYFVNSTTFIAATVQYVVPFDDDDTDEFFRYAVGIGFKW